MATAMALNANLAAQVCRRDETWVTGGGAGGA